MGISIDDLERAALAGWRAPEEARLGDWVLRAGGGFTGRANSALAIGDPGRPIPEAVGAVDNVAARALYRRIGFTDHHGYHYRIGP